jgi:CIC family chloride channel protein
MLRNFSLDVLQRIALRRFQRLMRVNPPEWATVMTTAIIVGVGAGLGAVAFRLLIERAQWLFFVVGAQVFGFLGDYYVLVIPALGGAIVGPLVYFFAREAKGHGVPEVMEAVALKGGRIRPRVAIIKSLASSISIGSGGSVGREGPIVQIGSALGSTVGQWLGLSDARIRSLVACGAAGGIAATFNAPIAGTIFALEVILGEIRATYFGAVVISAVLADVIAHVFEGSSRAFPIPAYELVNSWELLLYALLGIIAAFVAVLYSKTIYRFEDGFDLWKGIPEYVKPVVGGLGMGLIGIILVSQGLTFDFEGQGIPVVFGVGYETITPALLGQLSMGTALILLVVKLLATSVTLGSGGSGGVFAPSLFLGAMLGTSFGLLVNTLFPDATGPAGAYALVGMAAVFAGSAHAPATAILILFEMTGDYSIILPLMFATVISLIISRALEPESIYTMKLSRRGIRLQHGRDVDLMEGVTVAEAMSEKYETVSPEMPLAALVEAFDRTHHHGFPVVDADRVLVGIVTLTDLTRAMYQGGVDDRTVGDIATSERLLVAYPDETLATAVLRMGVRGVGRLPVVTRQAPSKYLGMLRRENIIRAYNRAITHRTNITHRLKSIKKHGVPDINVMEIVITAEMTCAERRLGDFAGQLPPDSIVASIQRSNRVLIPRGDTILQVGDHLTLLVKPDQAEAVQSAFC